MARKNWAMADAALQLEVRRVDPEDQDESRAVDDDGHVIEYETVRRPDPLANAKHPEPLVVEVVIPNGVDAREAASLLRKLADLVERHGGELLNLPVGASGDFDPAGNPVKDVLSFDWSDYDEDGRLKLPEVL
jgi:hypothetical protein